MKALLGVAASFLLLTANSALAEGDAAAGVLAREQELAQLAARVEECSARVEALLAALAAHAGEVVLLSPTNRRPEGLRRKMHRIRAVQEAAGLSRAAAVFLSTTDMERLRGIALTLHQNYPALDVYARVDSIKDQQELRARGIKHAATSFIESTLFRGASLLREMGVAEDAVASLLESLREREYAPVIEALGVDSQTAGEHTA